MQEWLPSAHLTLTQERRQHLTERQMIERLMNLHDVFLNASLQRRCMESSPLVTDAKDFHITDRARFERVWMTFLYVLVEAWRSRQMEPVRTHLANVLDCSELESTIGRLELQGDIAKMRDVRDYMCHRDERAYCDQGRVAVVDMLHKNHELHDRFGKTLLEALRLLDTD